MTTAVGILYPGHSAEDDYPRAEKLLADSRLPLVHTEMREDAHRVDALCAIGGGDVLAAGAREPAPEGMDSIVRACTSGSFVFGPSGAGSRSGSRTRRRGCLRPARRSRSSTRATHSGSPQWPSARPTRRTKG